MTKHTPGPWEIIDYRAEGLEQIEIVGPPDVRSNHRHGRSHVVNMRGWGEGPDDNEESALADARLIVAAPEMLAACERALGLLVSFIDIDINGRVEVAMGKLRLAIIKAKSGTP